MLRRAEQYILGVFALLCVAGCTSTQPQAVANPVQATLRPAPAGTIAAIRPEIPSHDPTGSLQQIMSILGQPVQAPENSTEIVMQLPGDVIKTNVQSATPGLVVGSQAIITPGPSAIIEPY